SFGFRALLCFVVARVYVTDHTHTRVGRQDALDALRHHVSAVGNGDLPSVQRITDANATSVVDRHPRSSCCSVDERVKDWPVGDRVAAILHAFGFAEWGSDRTAVEVIAPDDNRSLDLSLLDVVIDSEAERCSITITEPADPGRKTLKLYAFLREVDPSCQAF